MREVAVELDLLSILINAHSQPLTERMETYPGK